MKQIKSAWGELAESAQEELEASFWNDSIRMYNIRTPCPNGDCNSIFHYWWMAHAVDVLTDGYIRTGRAFYKERLLLLYEGLLERNGGLWTNNLYDDMEWMALAWLRVYLELGEERFKRAALTLWEDIRNGWNEHCGGGIAWQKTQIDYKNTPANAPAVILAARLYQIFGFEADLQWAQKIYNWQKRTLVDPDSGIVWDGINRNGDKMIDKEWKFTYCQGVFIGAGVELFRATGDRGYLEDAERTAAVAVKELSDSATGVLPAEGGGDGGLFKGIFVRYLADLALVKKSDDLVRLLFMNAKMMWKQGRCGNKVLFGVDWSSANSEIVELSTQLSGVMLLEMAAKLERAGITC
ncbi:MAG TPA: glycoside hydrolase family 76 protein [Bacilli bacterium]